MANAMRAALACVVMVCAAGRLAAQDAGGKADSAAVVALEHHWLSVDDSAALEQILAPDFLHPVSTGDIIDKAQHIGFVASHPRPASVHPHFERLDVRVYGRSAIATGIVAAVQDGKPGVRRTMFTDVFVKRAGRWQAVSAQETDVVPR
ncbi:MAG TPA: nuclear transport factor 2 family protein [Gemmatimonadaceae bacterium]|nr:nuclear transport factor 2 family protein [Gemmatimonadaceae bacterium]